MAVAILRNQMTGTRSLIRRLQREIADLVDACNCYTIRGRTFHVPISSLSDIITERSRRLPTNNSQLDRIYEEEFQRLGDNLADIAQLEQDLEAASITLRHQGLAMLALNDTWT